MIAMLKRLAVMALFCAFLCAMAGVFGVGMMLLAGGVWWEPLRSVALFWPFLTTVSFCGSELIERFGNSE